MQVIVGQFERPVGIAPLGRERANESVLGEPCLELAEYRLADVHCHCGHVILLVWMTVITPDVSSHSEHGSLPSFMASYSTSTPPRISWMRSPGRGVMIAPCTTSSAVVTSQSTDSTVVAN